MSQEAREKVVNYYNTTQKYYRRLWYKHTGLGLHYGFWTSDIDNRVDAIIKENEVLADLAGVQPGDLVLDAGCGVGGSGIWLAKERGAKVVGTNITLLQLLEGRHLAAQRGLSSLLCFVEADYHQQPFANLFDVFWSLESIEHARNIADFLSQAFATLKPEGKAIIAASFRGRDDITPKEWHQLQSGFNAAGAFIEFKTAAAVSRMMQQVGFVDVVNYNKTDLVMESARQMKQMCLWGLPIAKVLAAARLRSPILVDNNQWGIYQEGLFKSGALSYNVLVATKPK